MRNVNWKNWKELRRGDVLAGSCLAAIFAVLFGLTGDWLFGVLGGAVTWYAAAMARHAYIAALQTRAAAGALGGVLWDVELNGVKVGSVSDADYAAICLQAASDWRNYMAQILNIGRVVMSMFESLIVGVPVMVFWSAILAAIFAPDALATCLAELRSATPAQLAAAAGVAARVLAIGGALLTAGVATGLLGTRCGFMNCFGEAAASMLRRKVGAAAEGHVVLRRFVDSVPQVHV